MLTVVLLNRTVLKVRVRWITARMVEQTRSNLFKQCENETKGQTSVSPQIDY